jgi:hypothetical protein
MSSPRATNVTWENTEAAGRGQSRRGGASADIVTVTLQDHGDVGVTLAVANPARVLFTVQRLPRLRFARQCMWLAIVPCAANAATVAHASRHFGRCSPVVLV